MVVLSTWSPAGTDSDTLDEITWTITRIATITPELPSILRDIRGSSRSFPPRAGSGANLPPLRCVLYPGAEPDGGVTFVDEIVVPASAALV